MSEQKKIKTTYPEKHLYNKYDGQSSPQGTFLRLDPDERILKADWNAEIGNAIPGDVWHNRVFEYGLPDASLKPETIKEIMDYLMPLFERVCDGYYEEYDGQSNLRGFLDDDAREADDAIDMYLENYWVENEECIPVYNAVEFFGDVEDEIMAKMRQGQDPEKILEQVIEDCCEPEVIVEDMDYYIETLKDTLNEKEEQRNAQ